MGNYLRVSEAKHKIKHHQQNIAVTQILAYTYSRKVWSYIPCNIFIRNMPSLYISLLVLLVFIAWFYEDFQNILVFLVNAPPFPLTSYSFPFLSPSLCLLNSHTSRLQRFLSLSSYTRSIFFPTISVVLPFQLFYTLLSSPCPICQLPKFRPRPFFAPSPLRSTPFHSTHSNPSSNFSESSLPSPSNPLLTTWTFFPSP